MQIVIVVVHALISIHALLAESDRQTKQTCRAEISISIHALLAESDSLLMFWLFRHCRFLSTLSLRRATQVFQRIAKPFRISIHALLAESDQGKSSIKKGRANFYPRSPCGERRYHTRSDYISQVISIHALLAESDAKSRVNKLAIVNFYPRSPCGERLLVALMISLLVYFYPRSPCGERRHLRKSGHPRKTISIHALLAESDSKSAQNSGALLRIWNKFYGDFIFMLTGKAVFYPFCPCFFHIFWCEGTGNFMIAFPSH